MNTNNSLLRSLLIVIACFTAFAYAQQPPPAAGNYPNKPVRMLCGTTPASGSDIVNRMLAQKLSERLGQPVVVENRPGAAGAIALDMLAQATPDGYTLSVTSMSAMTGWMTQRKSLLNIHAYTPIVELTSLPYLVVVHPSLPANSVQELIVLARSKPGVLNYASAGIGSAAHLGMELFKSRAGVDIVHVPYAGSTLGLIDLVAGRVQIQINNIIASSALVKQGKLKALAVTTLKRVPAMPDLPTVNESGVPGFDLANTQGLAGPGGMPAALVQLLNREGSQFMNAPETYARVAADGAVPISPNSPEEFKSHLLSQIDTWGRIILKEGSKK